MALVTNIPITSATVDNMSRNEYLLWVNECLQSEFSKLEVFLKIALIIITFLSNSILVLAMHFLLKFFFRIPST